MLGSHTRTQGMRSNYTNLLLLVVSINLIAMEGISPFFQRIFAPHNRRNNSKFIFTPSTFAIFDCFLDEGLWRRRQRFMRSNYVFVLLYLDAWAFNDNVDADCCVKFHCIRKFTSKFVQQLCVLLLVRGGSRTRDGRSSALEDVAQTCSNTIFARHTCFVSSDFGCRMMTKMFQQSSRERLTWKNE